VAISNVKADIYAVKPVIKMLNRYASKKDNNRFTLYFFVKMRTIAKPGIKKQRAIAAPN
jgi:hypothetical protein